MTTGVIGGMSIFLLKDAMLLSEGNVLGYDYFSQIDFVELHFAPVLLLFGALILPN